MGHLAAPLPRAASHQNRDPRSKPCEWDENDGGAVEEAYPLSSQRQIIIIVDFPPLR